MPEQEFMQNIETLKEDQLRLHGKPMSDEQAANFIKKYQNELSAFKGGPKGAGDSPYVLEIASIVRNKLEKENELLPLEKRLTAEQLDENAHVETMKECAQCNGGVAAAIDAAAKKTSSP